MKNTRQSSGSGTALSGVFAKLWDCIASRHVVRIRKSTLKRFMTRCEATFSKRYSVSCGAIQNCSDSVIFCDAKSVLDRGLFRQRHLEFVTIILYKLAYVNIKMLKIMIRENYSAIRSIFVR